MLFPGAWLRERIKRVLRRFRIVIEFNWPTIGLAETYRVRPLRRDELVVLIWCFYGGGMNGDQIKGVLQKLLGTGHAEMKNVKAAVAHCEAIVGKMDSTWGPLLSKLIQ